MSDKSGSDKAMSVDAEAIAVMQNLDDIAVIAKYVVSRCGDFVTDDQRALFIAGFLRATSQRQRTPDKLSHAEHQRSVIAIKQIAAGLRKAIGGEIVDGLQEASSGAALLSTVVPIFDPPKPKKVVVVVEFITGAGFDASLSDPLLQDRGFATSYRSKSSECAIVGLLRDKGLIEIVEVPAGGLKP